MWCIHPVNSWSILKKKDKWQTLSFLYSSASIICRLHKCIFLYSVTSAMRMLLVVPVPCFAGLFFYKHFWGIGERYRKDDVRLTAYVRWRWCVAISCRWPGNLAFCSVNSGVVLSVKHRRQPWYWYTCGGLFLNPSVLNVDRQPKRKANWFLSIYSIPICEENEIKLKGYHLDENILQSTWFVLEWKGICTFTNPACLFSFFPSYTFYSICEFAVKVCICRLL